jgi:hypothetical protein
MVEFFHGRHLPGNVPAATSPRPAQGGPRLLDRVRAAARACHMSIRTEEAYVGWIRRFIVYHGKRHPLEMGEPVGVQWEMGVLVRVRSSMPTAKIRLPGLRPAPPNSHCNPTAHG